MGFAVIERDWNGGIEEEWCYINERVMGELGCVSLCDACAVNVVTSDGKVSSDDGSKFEPPPPLCRGRFSPPITYKQYTIHHYTLVTQAVPASLTTLRPR